MNLMKPLLIAAFVQGIVISPATMAQGTDLQSHKVPAGTQNAEPGQPSREATGRGGVNPSGAESSSKGQGTLMEKREQGMSPQGGASSGEATGKMPQ